MSSLDFGVFNEFWNGQPNHLPFLHLIEREIESDEFNLGLSIKLLNQILEENPEDLIIEGIDLLLKSEDWRPHLVASITVLKLDESQQYYFVDRLWNRIKNGSWTSPQLLVILSIIDDEFDKKARKIVEEGIVVSFSPLSSVESHTSRGPLGSNAASEKVKEAAYYLIHNSVIDSKLGDSGGRIAKEWKNSLFRLIENKKL